MKLSNSRLNSFRACPRRFFYEYVCEIEPITEGEVEHDRSFGAAIHVGLEKLYKGSSMEEALRTFSEAYPKQLTEDDLAKTQENGRVLIQAYWNRYSPMLKKIKILAVEVLEEYEPVEGLVFRVKVDMIAENIEQGGIYGYDFKTTGKPLNYRYWAQFNPNSQISTYFDFISKKYGSCSGFYIDAMSFGYRKNKYKGEPAGFHYQLDRQLYSQTRDQLDDWRESEKRWSFLLQDSILTNKYPMNTHSCQFCSYRPICAAGWSWELDKELIMSSYQKRSTSEQKENDNANSAGVFEGQTEV